MTNLHALFAQALAAHQAGRLDDAEALYLEVLRVDNRQPDPLYLLGMIAGQRGNQTEGILHIKKALKLDPKSADAWLNLGRLQGEAGDLPAAESSLNTAIALNPAKHLAFCNLVVVLRRLGRHDEALACSDRALALAPDNPRTLINRGNVLLALSRLPDAADAFRLAAERDAASVDAWLGLGNAEIESGRADAARAAFERAMTLDPTSVKAHAGLLKAKLDACSWDGIDSSVPRCLEAVDTDPLALSAPTLLALPTTAAQQLSWAESKADERFGHIAPTQIGVQSRPRIRVGYFSADFRDHATSHLAVGLFERHDRERFEIVGISHGLDDGSEIRHRVQAAFDTLVDISGLNTDEALRRIRALNLDIAVDMMGYTHMSRTDLFAHRVAPVQVNYLGYPSTMGATFMNYIIADKTIIPEAHEAFYAEKVARLPHTYQPNDDKRLIAESAPDRAAYGLPSQGFVFCCFNASFKITPDLFDVWMRLLSKVEGSVLWLFEKNSAITSNLRAAAEARGVAANRLVFASRMQQADHLARHRAADLFLDTLNYNAHTTASDALWAGLPLVTREGPSFPSRVASSLLRAAGVPELVTTSLEDYEALALKLASNPALLAQFKARLSNPTATPLFDTARYTRHLESAFTTMQDRALRGKRPASFTVKD